MPQSLRILPITKIKVQIGTKNDWYFGKRGGGGVEDSKIYKLPRFLHYQNIIN